MIGESWGRTPTGFGDKDAAGGNTAGGTEAPDGKPQVVDKGLKDARGPRYRAVRGDDYTAALNRHLEGTFPGGAKVFDALAPFSRLARAVGRWSGDVVDEHTGRLVGGYIADDGSWVPPEPLDASTMGPGQDPVKRVETALAPKPTPPAAPAPAEASTFRLFEEDEEPDWYLRWKADFARQNAAAGILANA